MSPPLKMGVEERRGSSACFGVGWGSQANCRCVSQRSSSRAPGAFHFPAPLPFSARPTGASSSPSLTPASRAEAAARDWFSWFTTSFHYIFVVSLPSLVDPVLAPPNYNNNYNKKKLVSTEHNRLIKSYELSQPEGVGTVSPIL